MNVDIANIIKDYLVTLPFADKVGGLVKTISLTQSDGERSFKKTFPVDFGTSQKDCTSGRYMDLIPNSKYKSIMYFEDGGVRPLGQEFSGFGFESSLKLVCWLNQKKLGKNASSISALAITTILKTLPTKPINSTPYTRIKIEVTSQDPKNANTFSKYSYDESVIQYLMYPYDYFALNITTQFVIPPSCIPSWEADPELDCE